MARTARQGPPSLARATGYAKAFRDSGPARRGRAENCVVAKLRALVVSVIIALLAAVPEPVIGPANVRSEAAAPVVPAVPRGTAEAAATSARCTDPAGNWLGMWWR